jgi:outer membrane protein, heavy metal efflux system
MKRWTPFAGALSASVVLAGCAAIPADPGATTATLLKPRSDVAAGISIAGSSGTAQSEVARILTAPMNAEAAVRVALLQSPRMRALYAQLGFAQADIYDASRLSNPSLGYVRITADGGASKTTWSLSQSFTELLFLGYRTRIGRSQLLQYQQLVASEILALEADVRGAYYDYVSAALIARMRARVAALTNESALYAQRLFDAGNINALQLSREQAMASEARVEQRTSAITGRTALSNLMSLLGLSLKDVDGAAQFVVMLPLPVALDADANSLQDWALTQRLDLMALREQVSMQETQLTHTRRWRWLGGVQGAAERERDGAETFNGFGAELELPLFNQGGGNLARAHAGLDTAKARLDGLETEIGNDMLVRYAALQAAQANVEEYRQKLVPLRERIVALSQQQQTFMFIGTFELLSAKQQELDTYQVYLEAVRDYWIAHTELRRTAGGKLPAGSDAEDTGISVGIDAQAAGADGTDAASQNMEGMDHSGHDMSTMKTTTGEGP